MAKSVISNGGNTITVSLADRKFPETKGTGKAICAGINWLVELHGEDVSLVIDFMRTLADRRTARREYQKNNPPASASNNEEYKSRQRKYLSDFGLSTEQIEALATKGHIGTTVVHEAIKSLVDKNGTDDSRAKVKSDLLALID